MKIYLMGRGPRLEQIRNALETSKPATVTLEREPKTVRFGGPDRPLANGDIVIVAEHEEDELRAILDNLKDQDLGAKVMTFTPLPTRSLHRDYPDVFFREEGLIYKNELRDLRRRAEGQQKVISVRNVVKGRPLLTVIWGNPDPDAIGSAYALQELMVESASECAIAYMGEFTRPENAAIVEQLKIPMVKFDASKITPETIVATVDAQPSFFKLDGPPRFDVIIDHHPPTELGEHRFADVRPTYGSASTILTEYFQNSGERMSKNVATALYYGLKTDTGNLMRNVSDADVAAFRYLRPRMDENVVRMIELSQLPRETLDFFSTAFANKKIVKDVAFAFLGTIANPDMCVHVADFFIKLAGISWAVVACRTKDRVVAVFRSDGFRRHAGRLAETLFLEHGSAGGHRTMARAELPMERIAGLLREPSDVAIEEWLLARLATKLKPLQHLP